MTHTITISQWHPTSLNKLMSGHWSKGARFKKADKHMVFLHSMNIPHATGKRRVSLHLTMAHGQRRIDADGLWKSCLDSLVHAKMLVNDSPGWVEIMPVTYERSGGSGFGTKITLEDL